MLHSWAKEMREINMWAGLKWITAAVVAFWAGLSPTLHVLITLMAVDYLTGVMGAIKKRRVDSDISFWGLMKKGVILLIIYSCHAVTKPLNLGFDLGEMVALLYTVNEIISILENAHTLDVPVPPIIMQYMSKLKTLRPEMPGDSVTEIATVERVVIPPANIVPKSTEGQKPQV